MSAGHPQGGLFGCWMATNSLMVVENENAGSERQLSSMGMSLFDHDHTPDRTS
jgi:hypothetical protein